MLGLLTQLEGNIQSGRKNLDIPEYVGEAGLCKCQTLSSITPTTTPKPHRLVTFQTLLTATTTKPLQGDAPLGATPGHKL